MQEELEFRKSPLGYHGLRKKSQTNFIDSFNAFWMWQYDTKAWRNAGRPNPFDDGDISVAQFMKANLGL